MRKVEQLLQQAKETINNHNKKLALLYDQIALEYYYTEKDYVKALKYGGMAHKLLPNDFRIHQNGEYYKKACFESYKDINEDLKSYLQTSDLNNKNILDIGTEKGQWGKYFRSICSPNRLDGIEAYTPYIEQYNLSSIYDNIYNIDIVNFHTDVIYDIIIMGDVLEHLNVGNAYLVLNELKKIGKETYIIVPYNYYQEEFDNNKYQIHIQDDLDEGVMRSRYPQLQLVWGNAFKGCYRII